jgi:hypothetical protein
LNTSTTPFFTYGPAIQYSSSNGFGGGSEPSYVDIMLATDATGHQRGFLASDEAYALVKDLEAHNLVVPVVGDFAGPKALRASGSTWLGGRLKANSLDAAKLTG